jgi:hypothetical protein
MTEKEHARFEVTQVPWGKWRTKAGWYLLPLYSKDEFEQNLHPEKCAGQVILNMVSYFSMPGNVSRVLVTGFFPISMYLSIRIKGKVNCRRFCLSDMMDEAKVYFTGHLFNSRFKQAQSQDPCFNLIIFFALFFHSKCKLTTPISLQEGSTGQYISACLYLKVFILESLQVVFKSCWATKAS